MEKKEDLAILVDWGKKTTDKFMSNFFMATCGELESQRASTTQQVIFTCQLFYRPTASSGIIDQILGSLKHAGLSLRLSGQGSWKETLRALCA